MKTVSKLFGHTLLIGGFILCMACQPDAFDPPGQEPFSCEEFQSRLDFSAFCGLDAQSQFTIVAGQDGHCIIHQFDPTPDWEYDDLITINISETDPALTSTLFSLEAGEPDEDLTEVEGIGDYCLVEERVSSGEVTALYFYFYKGAFLCYIEISGMECLSEENAHDLVHQISDLL